jgi:hypothetical protein
MLDVEWPDQLPSEFTGRLGGNNLRDTLDPEIPADIRQKARSFAEESTATIKREIFPVHSMTG